CTYCQTEIDLLREFQAATPRAGEADAVQSITARLQARSGEIFPARRAQPEVGESWWQAFWRKPWLTPVMLAVAGVAMVAVFTVQLRQAPPGLRPPDPNHETLRSGAIQVLAPA